MTMGILNAPLGQPGPIPNNTYCPTLDCRVEDVTSLAICSFCKSETIDFTKNPVNCSYGVHRGLGERVEWHGSPSMGHPGISTALSRDGKSTPSLANDDSIRGSLNPYADVRSVAAEAEEGSIWTKTCSVNLKDWRAFELAVRMIPSHWIPFNISRDFINYLNINSTQTLSRLPQLWRMNATFGSTNVNRTIGRSSMSWAQANNNRDTLDTVLSGCVLDQDLSADYFVNILNSTCITTSSHLAGMSHLDKFGEMNTTITNCRPSLCARRYQNVSIGGGGIKVGKITNSPIGLESGTFFDDHNKTFSIDTAQFKNLRNFLYHTSETENFGFLLGGNLLASGDDWVRFHEKASDVFTQVIQSRFNPNSTRVNAETYGSEAFVRVRWVWLIMPLSILVASNLLLCMTVYHSRGSPYLYKNSVLAILFHGMEGWETRELLPAKTVRRETYYDMLETSKRMRALLKESDDGYLKLKRKWDVL